MSFGDIVFQDRAVEFLTTSLKSGRLPHGLLFFGPGAVGKRFTAFMLAKALNCDTKGPGDCCDTCLSCRKIESLNHPDIHRISPEGAGNKIPIEAIKRLKEAINLKPFEGKAKVFVLDGAHLMTAEAANSMLKVLEEPPPHSFIILVSDDAGKIPATLRSRCQWVHFSQGAPERLRRFLQDRYGLDDQKACFLSSFSEGRVGKAISLKDKDVLAWKNDIVDRFTFEGIVFHEDKLFFDNERENILDAMDVLIGWYRDIFILKNGQDASLIINADRKHELVSSAYSLDADRIESILERILRGRADIEQNVNPKLVFADLACQILQR